MAPPPSHKNQKNKKGGKGGPPPPPVLEVAKRLHEMSDDAYARHIGAYKPGTIRRISLQNFLTYTNVEVRPGPRLNVVCGANGTGKSTLLNAICLGLGGEPKVLGRADDVRDFIMHGENVATVEIELEPRQDGAEGPHVIKRVMDRRKGSQSDKSKGRGSSTFYVNGEKSSSKAVQELVRSTYSISVDNLCTLLPQDKVGGFSAMTPQELLLETEKVLDAHNHFYSTHVELIEGQDKSAETASHVDATSSKLKKLQHENEQLEREKDRLEEREMAIRRLELLRKRELWLQFEAIRVRALELKDHKAELRTKLVEAQKDLEPLQVKVESAANKVKTMEAKERSVRDKAQKAQKEADRHVQKFQAHDDQIEEGVLNLRDLDDKRAQAEEKVRECQRKVDADQKSYDELPSRADMVQDKDAKLRANRDARNAHTEAKKSVRDLQVRLRDVQDKARASQSAVARLSDAAAQRRGAVFRKFRELESVCAWIDDNRGRFRRPVVGPVAAEITPSNAEAAAFVEQHVPNATLKAFCVETKEDRDLLYEEIRTKKGVPINILLLRKESRRPRVYSADKMRELGRYGVHAYLDELFTAPDAIMQAVIDSAQIDRVLVGDATTYQNMAEVKKIASSPEGGGTNLKSYVVCCHSADAPAAARRASGGSAGGAKLFKFTGTKSRYANQISVRQDDVEPSRCLSQGVDPAEMEAAQAALARAHDEVAKFRPRMDEAEALVREREVSLQESQAALEVATNRLNSHVKFEVKLQNSQRKLKEAKEAVATDDKHEKKKLAESIMNRLRNAITALDARSQQITILVQATADGLGVNANKTLWTTEQKLAELALIDKKQAFDELHAEANRVNEEFKKAKAELAAKNEVAKRVAPIADEDGNDLPLREELEELEMTSLDEVEVAIEECEAKASSIVANPAVIHQYEKRKQEIEELEAKLQGMLQEEADKASKLHSKSRRWERDLEQRIAEMNSLFSKYMAEMGNVGELQLYRGEPTTTSSITGGGGGAEADPEPQYRNYKDWGIKILVSFRGESKAQVLSAQSHSGGERAVSTIMYLMGAQHMLVSPFRCVDEINQGLDERNERLVFSRIVANACSRPSVDDPANHSGQYFLITPKILPNLVGMDSPGVHVLVVQNGPFNFFDYTDLAHLLPLYGKAGRTKRLALEGGDHDDVADGEEEEGDGGVAAGRRGAPAASEEWCENSGNSSSKGAGATGGGGGKRIPKKRRPSTIRLDDDEDDEA